MNPQVERLQELLARVQTRRAEPRVVHVADVRPVEAPPEPILAAPAAPEPAPAPVLDPVVEDAQIVAEAVAPKPAPSLEPVFELEERVPEPVVEVAASAPVVEVAPAPVVEVAPARAEGPVPVALPPLAVRGQPVVKIAVPLEARPRPSFGDVITRSLSLRPR